MSGSSLDGVDIALCRFMKTNNWSFSILRAETIEYHDEWKIKLTEARNLQGLNLAMMHVEYGHYLGKVINDFLSHGSDQVDFISSHGHTIFHKPEKRLTLQIGDGSAIAAATGLPAIYDFRSGDVALGGQGAPLVPVGDRLLFKEYDFCINIGGIANISFEENNERIAFDICPANQLLNKLCEALNMNYDKDGNIARKGNISPELMRQLDAFKYYNFTNARPRSLGNEQIIDYFSSILHSASVSLEDKLRTCTEHIAIKIAGAVNDSNASEKNMLLTGGGAFNKFLVELIKEKTQLNSSVEMILPSEEIIQFKEALVFAFLGVLRMRNETNILKSVTGASRDSVGGAVYDQKK
ncbi:MAG: anhydro-N-acetylmuramic acid kinase [Bacteroidia bacterium]|nr:anhydro-N-acetylmuramic acid kinase [Bacteroidia bacterium]